MSKNKKAPPRDIPNTLAIQSYLHCGMCIRELPSGESPSSYSRLSIGFTELGVQVWCNRHDVNVVHIDFEGACHPANLTVADKEKA